MTLDSLEVDLANCFDAGQAYVALSRATSMLSTRILSFNPHRVRAHPKVARFYLSLEAQRDREEAASWCASCGCIGAVTVVFAVAWRAQLGHFRWRVPMIGRVLWKD